MTEVIKLLHRYQVMLDYETFILMKSIGLFIGLSRNDLSLWILKFFWLFLSASVQWGLWLITPLSSNLWHLTLKSFVDFLGVCGREVVVDSFAEVTCFPNKLLRTNLAKVVFAARRVVQYFVSSTHNGASKTVRVDGVLAQQTSGVWTRFKLAIG